jgi:hypothetical protein
MYGRAGDEWSAKNLVSEGSARYGRNASGMLFITLVLHSDSKERTRGCMLKVGDEAPDFDLEAVTSRRVHRVKLNDFRGRNLVIAFHPLDWTPT